MMRRFLMAGMAVWLLRAAGIPAAAAADYLIDVWDTENNLPNSTVTAITQTPDHYLWIGTYNGLARFDGVRFVTFDPVNTPALGLARIQGLYVDARGTLWINTYRGGLTSYRNGVFQREWPDQTTYDLHTTLAWSSSNIVMFVTQFGEVLQRPAADTNAEWTVVFPPEGTRPVFQCADNAGRLWFLTREGRILLVQNGKFEELPDDGGLGDRRVHTVVTDARGQVWVGASNTIARLEGTRFVDMTPTNGEANFDPTTLFITREGALWVLANDRLRKTVGRQWATEATQWRGLLGWASGRAMGAHEDYAGGIWFNHYGNGLFHITPDGHYQRLTTRDGLPGDRVGAMYQGRDGGIWLGVDRGGLARLRDRHFQVLARPEGLTARTVLSVCQDPAGAVWIGTSGGGLCCWRDGNMSSYAVGNSASENQVFSIYPQAGGGLWLSAGEGEDLYQFRDGKVQRPPWEIHAVKAILADPTGRVWLGTKSGMGWWNAQGRRIFGTNDGVALSAVRALALAPDGTVWCGADDGTLYRCELDRLQAFRPQDSMGPQPIWSLLADADGTVWAGTFRGGLLRFKNGQFTRLTAKQGLPSDEITQILEDHQGQIWLGTHQGICRVTRTSLNACADGKADAVDCVIYGRLDGLPTLECSDGYQPACWHGSDDQLWFATVRGVVSAKPKDFTTNSFAPPVAIEELRVDGEPMALRHPKLVVPPGHNQFEFRFTALSFDSPDRTRFRYRMEGLDKEWVDAGTRRTAHYGHLPARNYRFHVMACDNEGVWSKTDAVVAFTVQPYFYQTWWFLMLASAAIIGGVAASVRTAANRKYRRTLTRLEQQHAIERERTRIAKDIHDDIGAGLTQITLLSELARREPEQTVAHLQRISSSARELTRAMDEIVWAVDPQHDSLDGLMDYISAYAEDFLRIAGIRCRMDLPTELPASRVNAEVRYNLFLALKEALNNTVKHAAATEVWLRLRIEPRSFALVVEDNGLGLAATGKADTAGISADRISSGSGLLNLEKRLTAIGGRCVVESIPGQGTRVEMTVRMNGLASPIVAIGHTAVAG